MMYSQILFYITAFFMLILGFMTIRFRNIFYSLLSAIGVFFLAAVIFWLLGSEYNAVIQLAIYGFAVPVILGLSIMFTNIGVKDKDVFSSPKSRYILFLVCGIFILAIAYLIPTSLIVVPDDFVFNADMQAHVNIMEIFSKGIFIKYVFAFEIISVILTIIVAGFTVFKRRSGE